MEVNREDIPAATSNAEEDLKSINNIEEDIDEIENIEGYDPETTTTDSKRTITTAIDSMETMDPAALNNRILSIVNVLIRHDSKRGIFYEPVSSVLFPHYFTVILKPICLKDIEYKVNNSVYTTFELFKEDIDLLISNCKLYNPPESYYHKEANNIYTIYNKLLLKPYSNKVIIPRPRIHYQIPSPKNIINTKRNYTQLKAKEVAISKEKEATKVKENLQMLSEMMLKERTLPTIKLEDDEEELEEDENGEPIEKPKPKFVYESTVLLHSRTTYSDVMYNTFIEKNFEKREVIGPISGNDCTVSLLPALLANEFPYASVFTKSVLSFCGRDKKRAIGIVSNAILTSFSQKEIK